MSYEIYETVTWKANTDVSDEAMIEAATTFSHTIRSLPGFLHQALYKNGEQDWVSVYYWATETDAKHSNDAVANDPHFLQLLSLIQSESIVITLYTPVQQKGQLAFT